MIETQTQAEAETKTETQGIAFVDLVSGLALLLLLLRFWPPFWMIPSWSFSSSSFSVSCPGAVLDACRMSGRRSIRRSIPVASCCLRLPSRRQTLRLPVGTRLRYIGALLFLTLYRRLWSVCAIPGPRSRGCGSLRLGWLACP